ncbi:YihY/virulence factor BrkB family protein [Hoeflea sp. AS60]|uniref:YihY/virulence factor BrkB family protein n=1 Tax=Hoeflea sp. AS60 TaxID=3135780 RepID=UPI00316DD3BD
MSSGEAPEQSELGRDATTPGEIPRKGLWQVLKRTAAIFSDERVSLVAAGVTYYLLLAVFPALAVMVAMYGFVADPADINDQIEFLSTVVPSDFLKIVSGQLQSLATQKTSAQGLAFVAGLAIAFWSANNGIKALFQVMNVAYGETEKRSFVMLNLITLAFTLGAFVMAISLITGIAVVPAVLSLLQLSQWSDTIVKLTRWPILLLVISVGISLLYRFGPSREKAKLRWLSWGAVVATGTWWISSILFSVYLERYADYNATYGTLGALIASLVWMWVSIVILILGARFNAELEHQTAVDSTAGHPQPIGERGAFVADTLPD